VVVPSDVPSDVVPSEVPSLSPGSQPSGVVSHPDEGGASLLPPSLAVATPATVKDAPAANSTAAAMRAVRTRILVVIN